MEASEIAELRTMYVFTPTDRQSWCLTFKECAEALRERKPDVQRSVVLRLEEREEGYLTRSVPRSRPPGVRWIS